RAARMPSMPAAAVSPAAADVVRNLRRSTVVRLFAASSRVEVVIDPSVLSGRLAFVDLLELAFGPLHGVLGLRALDGLGVHVDDDVLRVRLGGLGRRRARMPEGAGHAGRLPEHLKGLVDLRPHRVLFPLLGRAYAGALIALEPRSVVRVLV